MARRFLCNVCEQVEENCHCDKYCFFCLGSHDVRLVEDGCFYCLECREVCDYAPENKNAREG